MVTVTNLRCEHGAAALGIPTGKPRFGWQIDTDKKGAFQSHYRIQVAEDSAFRDLTWDSGWVRSRQAVMVEYEGPELQPRTSYRVRVSVRDRDGEESEWSSPAWFETGKLDEPWGAPFVYAPELDTPESSRPIYMRRLFELDHTVERARVYATALGLYELYVNGQRVSDTLFTPGWTNYRERLAYQVYDVTGLLRSGRNAIGAVLGPGWYKGELTWLDARNHYGDKMALSLELRVDSGGRAVQAEGDGVGPSDGVERGEGAGTGRGDGVGYRKLTVATDSSWTASSGPIQYSELYHGETYDGREELDGWTLPDFDDGNWSPVAKTEFDTDRVIAQDGPFVRPHERLKPVASFTTPRGERVLDFGQNLTGFVSFSVTGIAGERVVLSHAEVLDADGNFYTENMRAAGNRIEYTLRGIDRETYQPHFTFQGFRYVRVDEYPGELDPSAFEAVVVHSEMEPTLEFECSNEQLNQLHSNILWGWKGNALDIPTDCPQRDERLGWTGDAQVFIGTAAYLMNVNAFFRKWLRDLASEQLENGGVPFVIPDVLTGVVDKNDHFHQPHSSTGWGDAAVICPWTIYSRYGDRALLEEQYPVMKAWIEYIRNTAEDGLIWNSGFHFGDWVALDAKEGSFFGATPNDLTATAYYAYSTGLLADAARELDLHEDEVHYRELQRRIVEAFRNEFYTPNGRLAAQTQTAHILALAFDLVPEQFRQRTVDGLVRLIRENGNQLTTGFLGTPQLCPVLADNGRLDVAYELLMREEYPSWLYQVRKGATTIWEHWDGIKPDGSMWSPKMNSFNHYAYGAIGEWMYKTLGGIDLSPGRQSEVPYRIAPRPGGGIEWCRTTYRAPEGDLSLYWELTDGELRLEIRVPANASAELLVGSTSEVLTAGEHSLAVPYREEASEGSAVSGTGKPQ